MVANARRPTAANRHVCKIYDVRICMWPVVGNRNGVLKSRPTIGTAVQGANGLTG